MKEPAAIHALVEGRVQGVGFRYACCVEARRLGLSGRVRNNPGGDVEVWAEGPETELEELLAWLWEGPPRSRVLRVNHEWRPALGTYREFTPE